MFYVLVLAWFVGCGLVCFLRRVRHAKLVMACPIMAISGLVLSGLLFIYNLTLAGSIVLGFSLYITITLLISLKVQDDQMRLVHR